MKDYSQDPDFLDLIAAWHENATISEQRQQELLDRLDADPDLRSELACEIQMAALTTTVQQGESRWLKLEEKLATESIYSTNDQTEHAVMSRIQELGKPNHQTLTPSWWLGMSAAAAVLILGLSLLLNRKPTDFTHSSTVAKVIRLDGEAQINQAQSPVAIGSRLQAGDQFTMDQGLVELVFFDTGVHVLATAPLSFTAQSREQMFVDNGEIKLHVPPQGIGFVVETQQRKITDLGTSFVITARDKGSQVLVLDGQIAVGDKQGGKENLMYEGDLADFDQEGKYITRSGGPSGVPELKLTTTTPTAQSLNGQLLTCQSAGNRTVAEQLLPLIKSGFTDVASLQGIAKYGPFRFSGIAGTYDHFPEAIGVPNYDLETGWVAWYHGRLKPPKPGRYRFRGYADNHLLVSINGKPVFEGSRYSSPLRENLSIARTDNPSLPCLNSRAGFATGEWFEVTDTPIRIDLLFGEQGGGLTSGLLVIEHQGETYTNSTWGQPKWPLFLTEPATATELAQLDKLRLNMERKLMGSFSIDRSTVWSVEYTAKK